MKGWKILGKLLIGVGFDVYLTITHKLQRRRRNEPRVVYNALGGSMAPVWISQELGLFAKHGLQHNLNYMAATTAVQAIATGSEEIGLVGNQAIDLALEGADTVYVAGTVPRFIFSSMAIRQSSQSTISKAKSLRRLNPRPRRIMQSAWFYGDSA